MNKKHSCLLLFIILAMLFTTACDSSDTPQPENKGTLVINWPWMGEEREDIIYDAWDEFRKENERYNKWEIEIDQNDFELRDIKADIVFSSAGVYEEEYTEEDFFLELSEYGAEELKTHFSTSSWIYEESKIYGLPLVESTLIMSGDKAALDSIDRKLPKTYDELIDMGNLLGEQSINSNLIYSGRFISSFLNSGKIVSEDGRKAIFNQDDTLLKLFEEQVEIGTARFLSYYSGMEKINLVWGSPYSYFGNNDLYFSTMIGIEASEPGYMTKEVSNLAISKNSENKEAAYDFIKYLALETNPRTEKTYQEEFVTILDNERRIIAGVPTLRNVQEDLKASGEEIMQVYLKQLEYTKKMTVLEMKCMREVMAQLNQVVYNNKPIADALEEAERQANIALTKYHRIRE